MRVQTEEWRRFVPGIRMYRGKKTYFYNGEILWDDENDCLLLHNEEVRRSWQVIIVLSGVEEIPWNAFRWCEKLEAVIMSDTVTSIEGNTFLDCKSLVFVRLSRNLEYIGDYTFQSCTSLKSIFIPPTCTEIGEEAFDGCAKLAIVNIPNHTQLGINVFDGTVIFYLWKLEPIFFDNIDMEKVYQWIKNVNTGYYALHRLCCSTYENEALPISEAIYQEVKEHGPKVLQEENALGITPLKYLEENPYLENIDEMELMKRYIAEKMGQVAD
ncbi:hypothetical protein CTEN210_06634 [Chaetoceros tenuissimus]|uniref:Leucine-rich repeat domain-containing protein n=1 Tax=Chaetoceros tenuissimus TaxID=426638 RepID=A0AAD3CQR0_9STRA|nr:hypothetical protein CTEN210_06634 [Chaetoceros tenuissimus]